MSKSNKVKRNFLLPERLSSSLDEQSELFGVWPWEITAAALEHFFACPRDDRLEAIRRLRDREMSDHLGLNRGRVIEEEAEAAGYNNHSQPHDAEHDH